MEQVRVVIFDCDGVMFDSRGANEAYYNQILARFGRPQMNSEQCDYVHMHTAEQSVVHLFRNDPKLKDALGYWQRMSYLPFIPLMETEPYLKAFLEYLRPAYRTAISTNRSDTMGPVLAEHGLGGYFDLVVFMPGRQTSQTRSRVAHQDTGPFWAVLRGGHLHWGLRDR